MKAVSDMTPREILAVAVRSEIDAADVYEKLHDAVKNALLKKKLWFLLFEEKQHRKILERLYTQRFPQQKLEIPDHSLLPPVKIPPDKKASVLDLFNGALKAEKGAENFYNQAGKTVQDERSRQILSYLSRVERSHYFMIKSEIDLLDRFPEYYDIEDFHAGHDLVHLGP